MNCKKVPIYSQETTVPPPPPPPPPLPPTPSNQNIWAETNKNITIELPMNFAILNGEITGAGRTGAKVKWEKIYGPGSCLLESPDSSSTKVTNLEKGAYAFQLSATSNTGQTSTDRMQLIVQDATSANKQIFFWGLNWSCPFGCSIRLGYVLSYLPSNSPFTLYIRRDVFSDWDLIVPASGSSTSRFIYSRQADHIYVSDTSYLEPSTHAEMKIVF